MCVCVSCSVCIASESISIMFMIMALPTICPFSSNQVPEDGDHAMDFGICEMCGKTLPGRKQNLYTRGRCNVIKILENKSGEHLETSVKG